MAKDFLEGCIMNSDLAYNPPYTLSETAVSLIADIAVALERYKIVVEGRIAFDCARSIT